MMASEGKCSPDCVNHKVVEFFSGIGGWSCALSRLSFPTQSFTVVAAFDINTLANDVYSYNHNLRPSGKSLERVDSVILDKFEADVWVMSPPCQPFTRNNMTDERDVNDNRSRAFLYLIEQLQLMQMKPAYIALENVVGFESSVCCETFLGLLTTIGYHYEQFHLDPLQFGIPNSRPRYYCTAWLKSAFPSHPNESPSSSLQRSLPNIPNPFPLRPLQEFLDPPSSSSSDDTILEEYYLPASLLDTSAAWCLDIQSVSSTYTSCFTKSYGRYIKGTGSVLLSIVPSPDPDPPALTTTESMVIQHIQAQQSIGQKRKFEEHWWKDIQAAFPSVRIRIRYFTPRELLRLFGFPNWFQFAVKPTTTTSSNPSKKKAKKAAKKASPQECPEAGKEANDADRTETSRMEEQTNSHSHSHSHSEQEQQQQAVVTTRKQYELIGNSINVTVVMHLLEFLFSR